MNSPVSFFRMLVAGCVLLTGAAASTPASAVDILTIGHGTTAATPCSSIPNCLDITAIESVNDYVGLASPIPDSWTFSLSFRAINGIGSGTWKLSDLSPAGNDLFGTSTHMQEAFSANLLRDTVQIVISGGSGIFAGATGTGLATAYINVANGTAVDSSVFSVTLVPEPSTLALMVIGLLTVSMLASRRRS